VKIMGGVSEIFLLIVIYDRTSEIHLMAIHCAAAKHGELIKKTKEKSLWVKLKVKTKKFLG